MYNSSFIISTDTLETYNQIKGKNMVGYFRNNELVKINVDGNAQTVYYVREDDGYLIGINLAESSTMTIRLKDNHPGKGGDVSRKRISPCCAKIKRIYLERRITPERSS